MQRLAAEGIDYVRRCRPSTTRHWRDAAADEQTKRSRDAVKRERSDSRLLRYSQ